MKMAAPFFAWTSGRFPFFAELSRRAGNCFHNSAPLAKNLKRPKFGCQQDKIMWKLLSKKGSRNVLSPLSLTINQGILPKNSDEKTARKTKQYKQSVNIANTRMSMVGANLRRHLVEIFSSNMVQIPELLNVQIDILKVNLTKDLRNCFAYWRASGDEEKDDEITDILNKYSNPIRSILIDMQVLGRMPKLVFVKDTAAANLAIIDRLLAQADMGEDGDTDAAATEDYQTVMEFHSFAKAQNTVQQQPVPSSDNDLEDDDEISEGQHEVDFQKMRSQLVAAKRKNKLWKELEGNQQLEEDGKESSLKANQFSKLQQVKRKAKKREFGLDNKQDDMFDTSYEMFNEENDFNIYNEDTDLENDSDK